MELLEKRDGAAVEKWFSRDAELNVFYSSNIANIKNAAQIFIDRKNIEKEFKEQRKRRERSASFSYC